MLQNLKTSRSASQSTDQQKVLIKLILRIRWRWWTWSTGTQGTPSSSAICWAGARIRRPSSIRFRWGHLAGKFTHCSAPAVVVSEVTFSDLFLSIFLHFFLRKNHFSQMRPRPHQAKCRSNSPLWPNSWQSTMSSSGPGCRLHAPGAGPLPWLHHHRDAALLWPALSHGGGRAPNSLRPHCRPSQFANYQGSAGEAAFW